MGRKPYRVELNYSHGRAGYFLMKDVRVGDKKRKTRKYLGHSPPSAIDVERYRKEYAYEIEMRAARKKAEMTYPSYKSEYLTKDQIIDIENIRFMYDTFYDLLTTNEIEVYELNFDTKYIQGTTAIEGNTLSLSKPMICSSMG